MDGGSEKQLIARCKRGEADAWDELFDRYYPLAGKFIYQMAPTFTPEDVDEICQEVFLAVVKSLEQFQGRSQFQTWLFRIAANKARDAYDHQRAARRGGGVQPCSLDAEDRETGMKLDPPSSQPGPDQTILSAEQMLLLREALDRLGDPCREIIEMKYFGNLSYDEISQALSLNPKTVSSRLSKCLDKLEEIAKPLFAGEKTRPFSVQ